MTSEPLPPPVPVAANNSLDSLADRLEGSPDFQRAPGRGADVFPEPGQIAYRHGAGTIGRQGRTLGILSRIERGSSFALEIRRRSGFNLGEYPLDGEA